MSDRTAQHLRAQAPPGAAPSPAVAGRARAGVHDAYQALADRRGARSLALGGVAAVVTGVAVLRRVFGR